MKEKHEGGLRRAMFPSLFSPALPVSFACLQLSTAWNMPPSEKLARSKLVIMVTLYKREMECGTGHQYYQKLLVLCNIYYIHFYAFIYLLPLHINGNVPAIFFKIITTINLTKSKPQMKDSVQKERQDHFMCLSSSSKFKSQVSNQVSNHCL